MFINLINLFSLTHQYAKTGSENKFLLSPEVIDYIKGINIKEKRPNNFNVKQHFSCDKDIYGIKFPLTYEDAIKNPSYLKDIGATNDKKIEMEPFIKQKTYSPNSEAFKKKPAK